MNKRLVFNAVLIWKELSQRESQTVKRLRSLTKLTEIEIEASLEWLKHEKKITVLTCEDEKRVSRADEVLIYI